MVASPQPVLTQSRRAACKPNAVRRGVQSKRDRILWATLDPRALEGHRSRPATCSAPAGRVSSLLKRSGATAAGHTSHRLLRVPPIRLLPVPESHSRDDAARGCPCPRAGVADKRSQDGEAQSASSERSPGWAQRVSGDGHGQPRASSGSTIAILRHGHSSKRRCSGPRALR